MELLTPVMVFKTPQRHEGRVTAGKPDPAYRAYELLYLAFIIVPLAAGIDKYFNLLTDWTGYLSPPVSQFLGDPAVFLRGSGLIEIAAGLLVALSPRVGAMAVAVWLWMSSANLLLFPGFYDVVLRDLALSMAALALFHLAEEYHRDIPL